MLLSGLRHADSRRFLTDKLLGNRMAVMLGALLMAIGHLVLECQRNCANLPLSVARHHRLRLPD